MFNDNIIYGRNIDETWRKALWCCAENGYLYRIEKGSYQGQQRSQLEYLISITENPGHRPLAVHMPEKLELPSPANEERIGSYFANYLFSDKREDMEDYTYGEYIVAQLPQVIEMLIKSSGNTNQAIITIGEANSLDLESPPCLRIIDFKKTSDGSLNMHLYFRSWCLFTGLPENLAGMQLLKEYVLMELSERGLKLKDGKIITYSSGAHVYDHYFIIANKLSIGKKFPQRKGLDEK